MRTLLWFAFLLLCGGEGYFQKLIVDFFDGKVASAVATILILGFLCVVQDIVEIIHRIKN